MSNSEFNHYFPHDSNARSDDKMLSLRSELGNKAYAIYFMILELMREEDNYCLNANGNLAGRLSMELNEPKDFMEDFIKISQKVELFDLDGDRFYSEEFIRRMAYKDEKSEKARKAAYERWHGDSNADEEEEQSERNADAMHSHSGSNANKKNNKKKKEKNKNNNIPYSKIIDYLNKKADRQFKSSTPATKRKIEARWNEGFDLDDFKNVIDTKVAEWKNDEEMEIYLRPKTLFGTKFEGYLNQPMPGSKPKKSRRPQTNMTEEERKYLGIGGNN